MKYLILTSLAAMAAANPNSVGDANQANSPPAKLPFLKASSVKDRCGGQVGFVEVICGTERFCEAYETDRKRTNKKFETKAACLEAREAPSDKPSNATEAPLAWLEEADRRCGIEGYTDILCGTKRYCETFDTIYIRRSDMKFASSDDCFAAHDPNPAAKPTGKLEYLLPGKDSRFCGVVIYDERSCGTKRYCQAFDTERELALGTYKSAGECFEAHQAAEKEDLTDTRIDWQAAWPDSEGVCDRRGFYDVLSCGTDTYCNAFDTKRSATDLRFESTQDCFAAFKPNPATCI